MKVDLGKLIASKLAVVTTLSVTSFLFLLAGFLYYNSEKESIVSDINLEIKTITELKRDQITNWFAERRGDASVVSSAPFMKLAIANWIRKKYPQQFPPEIIERLAYIKNAYKYEDIIVGAIDDKIFYSVNSQTRIKDPPLENELPAINDSKIVVDDFKYCTLHGKIHLDIIAPLLNESGSPFGILIFRIDPNEFLYPLIQTWPTPSKSAETFLSERIGGNVIYLNELRHQKGTALNLKFPLSQNELPAVKAAEGLRGIYEGYDYAGEKVLSYITQIDLTGWNLISKINSDEIFYELSYRSIAIAIVTLFLILLSGSSIAFIYYSRERNTYRKLFAEEKKFTELNKMYKTTLYSIGDAVITTDTKGSVTAMNSVAEKLTGWKETEAVNLELKKVFNIINEYSREPVDDPVKKVLRKGLIVGLANHTLLIAKDGSERPIADSGAPVRDQANNIIGVVLVFRDQTEERKRQNQLIESEKKFRDIVTYLDEGYYSVTLDGILLEHNQAFNRILGFEPGKDLRGTKLIDFWVNKGDREIYLEGITKNGYIRNFIVEARKVDGTRISNMVNCHLVKDVTGNPLRIEGTFTDVTEKRRNEQIIEANEKRLRTLFESMNELVFVVHKDGTFLDFVATDASLLFVPPQEIIGKKINQIFPPDKAEYFTSKINLTLNSKAKVNVRYSLTIGEKDFWFEGVFTPLHEDRIMCVVHDVTEQKLHEEKVKQGEQKFRDLAELLPQIVFESDEKGMITFLNRVAYETVGKSEEDLSKGINVLEFLIPEDRQKAVINFQKRLNGELTGHTEYTALVKDGRLVPIIIYATPIIKEGRATGLRGVIIDITEIKKAKETILKEKQFSDSLIEDLPGVFYLFDQNGKFKKWNKNYEIVTGYSGEEISQMTPLHFFKGDDVNLVHQRIGRVFVNGKADVEALFTTKDGRGIPYYFTGNLIMIDNEPHLVGMGIDISERKQFEKSLQEFHDAVNESGDVVFTTNKAGIITSMNSQFQKFYGYTEEEILDRVTPRILKSGAQSKETYKAFWKIILSGDNFHGEVINKTKSGELLFINETVTPISDATGNIKGFLAIQRDVSERAKYQKEIERRNEELNALNILAKELVGSLSLEKTMDSIIENIATPLNASMVLLFEIQNNHLELVKIGPKGSKYHENAEELLHVGQCLCGQAVFTKKPIFSIDIMKDKRCTRNECKNAGIKSFTCIPLFKDNVVIGALGIGSEVEVDFERSSSFLQTVAEEFGLALNNINLIAEIKTLNEELELRVKQRTAELETANKELESFSYSVSHDLRAPVRAIAGFSQMLNSDHIKNLNDDGKELLKDIISNTERMTQLIDDLLEFSRLQRKSLDHKKIDMKELFSFTFKELKSQYSMEKVTFEVADLHACFGDYSLMKQVVTNLLSNAVKFSSKKTKPVIVINSEISSGEIIYSVKDNGVGFSMQYVKKLFGVFQRLHGLNEFEGTGVGLAIVQKVIHRHGGRVWAEAKLNKGATFFFSLPIMEADA